MNKESWKQQALVYIDVADLETKKAIKARMKTVVEMHNFQKKLHRGETKINQLLEIFEKDKNIMRTLHQNIVTD